MVGLFRVISIKFIYANLTFLLPVGIWPKFSDGSDINAIDKSNMAHANGTEILATGDDFGKVKLFKYPCIQEHSNYVAGKGHSSHVSNVKFTIDDQHLISIGGNDQCIF